MAKRLTGDERSVRMVVVWDRICEEEDSTVCVLVPESVANVRVEVHGYIRGRDIQLVGPTMFRVPQIDELTQKARWVALLGAAPELNARPLRPVLLVWQLQVVAGSLSPNHPILRRAVKVKAFDRAGCRKDRNVG